MRRGSLYHHHDNFNHDDRAPHDDDDHNHDHHHDNDHHHHNGCALRRSPMQPRYLHAPLRLQQSVLGHLRNDHNSSPLRNQ